MTYLQDMAARFDAWIEETQLECEATRDYAWTRSLDTGRAPGQD